MGNKLDKEALQAYQLANLFATQATPYVVDNPGQAALTGQLQDQAAGNVAAQTNKIAVKKAQQKAKRDKLRSLGYTAAGGLVGAGVGGLAAGGAAGGLTAGEGALKGASMGANFMSGMSSGSPNITGTLDKLAGNDPMSQMLKLYSGAAGVNGGGDEYDGIWHPSTGLVKKRNPWTESDEDYRTRLSMEGM